MEKEKDSEMAMKRQYYVIDILKYIFCIGIVALHTGALSFWGDYEYWVERGFVRLGVPFFFMVSGFMLEAKISKTGRGNAEIKNIFVAWSKRLLLPLIVFEVIDLVTNTIYSSLLGDSIFKIVLRAIRGVIFYPGGALWYLQACLVGVWIIYFFLKHKKQAWIFPIGTMLYIFALICNSYYFLIQDTIIGQIITLFLYLTSSARNGLFYGFFFLALGMLAYRLSSSSNNRNNAKKWNFILVLVYSFYFAELIFLRGKEIRDDGSLFITLPLITLTLLVVVSRYTSMCKRSVWVRNLSTGVYLLHCPIRNILQSILIVCDFSLAPEILFLLVLLISHVVCIVAYAKNLKFAALLK